MLVFPRLRSAYLLRAETFLQHFSNALSLLIIQRILSLLNDLSIDCCPFLFLLGFFLFIFLKPFRLFFYSPYPWCSDIQSKRAETSLVLRFRIAAWAMIGLIPLSIKLFRVGLSDICCTNLLL